MNQPITSEKKTSTQDLTEPSLFPGKGSEKKKKWKKWLLIIPLLLFAAFYFLASRVSRIEGEAELKASKYLQIGPVVQGILTTIHHQKGASVAQGDLLAQLENPDLERELAGANKNLDLLISQRDFLQKRSLFRKREHERKQLLFENGVIGRSELEASEMELSGVSKELEEKAKEIEKAQGVINALRHKEKALEIYAPFSGLLLSDPREKEGNLIKEGDPLFELADPSSFFLQFLLPESDVRVVNQGDSVEIRFKAWPEKKVSGEIRKIGRVTEKEVEKVFKIKHVVPIEIALLGSPPEIRIGMRAWIRIRGRRIDSPGLSGLFEDSKGGKTV